MASYIEGLTIGGVNIPIDHEGLVNKPSIQTPLSDTDGGYGQRIKAIEDTLAAAIDFETQSY